MRPRAKLYLSSDECEGVFGEGKFQLLTAVKEQGSISKAAIALGRSYRKAWGDIQRAEEGLGRALVMKIRGGSVGGRSSLTDFGEGLLTAWEKHRAQAHGAIDRSYAANLAKLLGPADTGTTTRRRRKDQLDA